MEVQILPDAPIFMYLLLTANYNRLSRTDKRQVRLEYVRQQKNKCWYCEGDLNQRPPKRITDKPINWNLFPEGFLNSPIHLQHDHDTGMTEGAVHAYCNAVLWQYFDR